MNSLFAVVYASTCWLALAGSGAPRIPEVPFEKYQLDNGLQVILHVDHSIPIVAVNVWYHAGSKNEQPGRTGFAHLFEHMMFQGSQHHDRDYFLPLEKAGGRLNGSTSLDRTNYWETVPSNYLELALWMESDRMGFLLPAMTQGKLDNQRDVVKNERRQSYENRPYGLVYETILAAMYPPDHPYSWPTIGTMTDLSAASRKDVADFFRRYYHPGNASLCIAGDFEPAEAKRLVAKYFGPLPTGPKVGKLKPWVPELNQQERIRMTDRVGLARLYVTWHTVPLFAADEAELRILADVLTGGKTSRLYRSLVREKQIAQDVDASQDSFEIAGEFSITATARPEHTLAELEAALTEELDGIERQPPTPEEVARALSRHEAQLVRSLEALGGFGGRADRLNMYNVYTGDPGYLSKDFGRYLAIDGQAVARVAKKYLNDKRIVLEVAPGREVSIIPDPRKPAAAAREELAKRVKETPLPESPAAAESFDRSAMPQAGPQPKFQAPSINRRKLANGMEVLVVEKRAFPMVHVHALFGVGQSADPASRVGLAGLMAAVWDEGTGSRSAIQIADALADIGASLSISTGWDVTAVRLFSLQRHLPKALEIYGDVLQHPAFHEPEFSREQSMALGRLAQVRNEPTLLASMAVPATIYGPDHPYGRPEFGTPGGLRSITTEDLRSFYRAHVRPDQASLIVVGDVTAGEVVRQLEGPLSEWRSESASPAQQEFPPLPPSEPTRIILVDRPGAAQSVICVALQGARRNSPDYFSLLVMNTMFGGQFTSRLNLNLREDKGYTYGARSLLDWRVHQPGLLVATASVQTAVTGPALAEFLRELKGMTGQRPVEQGELEFSKAYLTRGYPASFEISDHVAVQLETLVEYALPDDYFNTFTPKVRAVTTDDVLRVAQRQLDLEHLAIIVVGDRAKIEASLREMPGGKNLAVVQFDQDFRLVPVK